MISLFSKTLDQFGTKPTQPAGTEWTARKRRRRGVRIERQVKLVSPDLFHAFQNAIQFLRSLTQLDRGTVRKPGGRANGQCVGGQAS